ncbi:MAG: hypothetical protein J7J99_04185 [Thermoprotei archaeon]|nr:hypothetical protein [Thermoprotei archaeon]
MSESSKVEETSEEIPESEMIQCPCGRFIKSPAEYKLLYLKKEQNEIDILCPNDACYLRELGFVKFKVDEVRRKLIVQSASFYPPFVTWNAARLGAEKAHEILKQHLKEIVTKYIDWNRVKEDYFKRLEEAKAKAAKEESSSS